MERDNEKLKEQGKKLIDEKEYQRAIEVLLQMDNFDWGKPFQLGRANFFLGNYKEALEYFKDYYRRIPIDGGYWIGRCYESLGEMQKAACAYEAEALHDKEKLDTNLCMIAGDIWKELNELERAKRIWYTGFEYEWLNRKDFDTLNKLCRKLGYLELGRKHIDVGVWYMCQLAVLGDTGEEENLARQGYIRQEDDSFISMNSQNVFYSDLDGLMEAEARYYYIVEWNPEQKTEPEAKPTPETTSIPETKPTLEPVVEKTITQTKTENKVDKIKRLFGGFLK